MKLLTPLLIITCLFVQDILYAQHTNIRQWQANYAYTNPAFTGISINPRIHGSYQQIYPNLLNGLRIYELSYDQRISPKAGFIGLSMVHDVTSQIATRQVTGLQYAYEFKLSDEVKLRAGATVSYVFLDVDSSKIISASPQNFPDKKAAHFGVGSIISYRNIFAGISAFNFSKPMTPKNSDGRPVLVSDISAQAGGFFPINKSNPKSTVIAPYFLFYGVTKKFAVAPGVNVNKGIFTGGLCYRGNSLGDAVAILAGVSKGWIKAGYTYDLGLPDARSIWAASHELTLTVYPGKMREESKQGIPYYFRKMGF